jgi:hypothetical protein
MNTHLLTLNLLLASLAYILTPITVHAQEAWPGTGANSNVNWVGYLYANTMPVQDPANDVGNNNERWDLTFVTPTAPYTVQAAANASTAFFRLQVKEAASLGGPGTYYVFIGNDMNQTIGMVYFTLSGNSGSITVANAIRNPETQTASGLISSSINGYARVEQIAGGTAYIDFQTPLSTIYTNLGISSTTPIKFYSGTSSGSGNIGNVNRDWMTPGNTVDFSDLATASFNSLQNNHLPVELTSFTAHIRQGTVQLKWRTETETDNYGFEILRSLKKDVWDVVDFVHGHGTVNSPRNYTYNDPLLKNSNGTIFYRLRQIDRDGSDSYSSTVMVRIAAPSAFAITDAFPNPFNPATTLTFSLTEASNVTLRLYDVTGKVLLSVFDNTSFDAGSHSITINANELPGGRYMAVMQTDGHMSAYPLLLTK